MNPSKKWLRDNLGAGSTNLSVEESLAISKKFLRQMAQPFPREAQFGIRFGLFSSLNKTNKKNLKFIGHRSSSIILETIGA